MSTGLELSTGRSCGEIGPNFVCDPPVESWALFLDAACPMLLLGTQATTDAVIAAVMPFLRLPRWRVRGDGELILPSSGGVVILDRVDLLGASQQVALRGWLSARPVSTQVIATTPIFLYGRVQQGLFLEDLYYRLNVIHIQITSQLALSRQLSPADDET
jgi:hypothetical protein